MDVQTPPSITPAKQAASSALSLTLALFAVLWVLFFALERKLPYLKNGSDVVFDAKLRWEQKGQVFPADPQVTRVLIFGNSKILAGFIPALFDQLSAEHHLNISSFNSGFPGSDLFLPPLETLCKRGQAPNILLMTLPWRPSPPKLGIFHFIADDHAVIDNLFPFRNLFRDAAAFLLNAPGRGGVKAYYREAQQNERQVIAERGYHLITEQSRFPNGHLPDDFHLASDLPNQTVPRIAPAESTQLDKLDQLIQQYHMRCYYVPLYLRDGEAAVAPEQDAAFAAQLKTTQCKLLGPDYYLYPNRLFADQTHLNSAGARLYTQALFELLKNKLTPHALQ